MECGNEETDYCAYLKLLVYAVLLYLYANVFVIHCIY